MFFRKYLLRIRFYNSILFLLDNLPSVSVQKRIGTFVLGCECLGVIYSHGKDTVRDLEKPGMVAGCQICRDDRWSGARTELPYITYSDTHYYVSFHFCSDDREFTHVT